MTGEPEEVAVELERLRKLEQSLRAERERIRAAAAGEVLQLQTALRESAARAAQREREVQGLRTELQRGSGGQRLRRRRLRPDRDATGAVQRVLATFERERQQLEERARAVAQTELRQRKLQAELQAEIERVDRERREAEAALLAARSELAATGEGGREMEERIGAVLALREEELERRAEEELERLRSRLEGELAEELARRRDQLEREAAEERRRLQVGEEEVSRREVELSLLRRRIGDEERRLQERTWRTGALQRHDRAAVAPRPAAELSFSEGWRLLSRGRDGEPPAEHAEWGGGNW